MENDRTLRPCLVTGHLLPWTGGPLKSISAFQRALDANVVSFLERRHLGDHALPLPAGRLALVPCHRLPGFRHFLWPEHGQLTEARQLLSTATFASCHSFYNYHPVWMHRLCRQLAIPYWIVPHGIFDPYVAGRNRIVKSLYMTGFGRTCLTDAAATIFSSQGERDKAVRQFPISNPVVIHWPVSFPVVSDTPGERATLRQRLGLSEEARIMLCLGRLHSMKRPLETIRLFAEGAVHGWHLLLVGHPEDVSEEECRDAARGCGVADRVHVIPGIRPEVVNSVIQGCDILVSFSRRENFNNAAAECLAAGLPLLLSIGNDLVSDIGESDAVGVLPEAATDAAAVLRTWMTMGSDELVARGRVGAGWAAGNLTFNMFRTKLHELRDDTLACRA